MSSEALGPDLNTAMIKSTGCNPNRALVATYRQVELRQECGIAQRAGPIRNACPRGNKVRDITGGAIGRP